MFSMTLKERYNLAANQETPPETLRELSQSDDPSIRQAISGNPNTPIDLLWNLLPEFPHEIVANPVFSLIRFTDLDWIKMVPDRSLIQLFKQKRIPEVFIQESLKYRRSEFVMMAIITYMASDSKTSREELEKITLTYGRLDSSIVHHPNFGIESFKIFAEESNFNIQQEITGYCLDDRYMIPPHLSRQALLDQVLPTLVDQSIGHLVFSLLTQPALPTSYIPGLLIKMDLASQMRLAKGSWTPRTVLEQLGNIQRSALGQLSGNQFVDTNLKIRLAQALIKNPQIPEDMIQHFSDSPYKTVRAQVARQIALSSDLFIKLAQDTYPRTRLSILANRKINCSLLCNLTKHPNPEVSQLAKQHPNTPKYSR